MFIFTYNQYAVLEYTLFSRLFIELLPFFLIDVFEWFLKSRAEMERAVIDCLHCAHQMPHSTPAQ
jgi:hypothetical protein